MASSHFVKSYPPSVLLGSVFIRFSLFVFLLYELLLSVVFLLYKLILSFLLSSNIFLWYFFLYIIVSSLFSVYFPPRRAEGGGTEIFAAVPLVD